MQVVVVNIRMMVMIMPGSMCRAKEVAVLEGESSRRNRVQARSPIRTGIQPQIIVEG